MPTPRQAAARCARRGRVSARDRHGAARARTGRDGAAPSAADAAVVAESKRNYVYGLHAVTAALERAPERVLELWIAQPRDEEAPVRELKERTQRAGAHIHSAAPPSPPNLLGHLAPPGP